MPSPTIRLMKRWPKISTTSTMPETRMKIQPHFSRLKPRWRRAGATTVCAVISGPSEAGEREDQVAGHEARP